MMDGTHVLVGSETGLVHVWDWQHAKHSTTSSSHHTQASSAPLPPTLADKVGAAEHPQAHLKPSAYGLYPPWQTPPGMLDGIGMRRSSSSATGDDAVSAMAAHNVVFEAQGITKYMVDVAVGYEDGSLYVMSV